MLKRIFSICVLVLGTNLSAQSFQLGGHVGALGASTGNSEIGYGLHFVANPYNFMGFKMDLNFASMSGETYLSTGPALIVYPLDFAEFKLGLVAGAGFHRMPFDKTRFAINYGIVGDFLLTNSLTVGFDTRHHAVFDVEDMWNVFLTMAYRFDLGGW